MPNPEHQPVLVQSVLELLAPAPNMSYLDMTAGYGGTAAAIAERIGQGRTVLVDRDRAAIQALKRRFKQATIIHADFDTVSAELLEGRVSFDMIMMDLGLSSPQLADAKRGMSFMRPGPLDMRMDQRQSLTAADVINHFGERDLANLIYRLGEERLSRRIARAIVAKRPFKDSGELATVIAKAVKHRGRIHPATRTFQAIRLAVNDELGQIERTVPRLTTLLKPGGRLAIISFHSLEDRLIKRYLRDTPELTILTKRPIMGKFKDVTNPRARSSRLRAAIKIKNKRRPKNGNQTQSSRQQQTGR